MTAAQPGGGLPEQLKTQYTNLLASPIPGLEKQLQLSKAGAALELELDGSSKALFNSRLRPIQVLALCEALQSTKTPVESLSLKNNFLDDSAAQALAGLIKSGCPVYSINLEGNGIGPQGAAAICQALAADSCCLRALSLSGNPLGEEGMMAIGAMLRRNTSLGVLDVSNVGAGVRGLLCVSNAMGADGGAGGRCNSHLAALDLGAPVIHMTQDSVILSLARMLAANTSLRSLGLSKHRMVDSQLETLVTYGLLRNKSITSLDLRANRLSGFSGAQLERLLSEAPAISHVVLSANMLGDAGALALARSLPYCSWLSALDLRSNGIGERGLVALAEAVAMSPHAQELLVWGNAFGPAACRAFTEALGSPRQGQAQDRLRIDVQPFEVDGQAQLALLQVD